MESAHLACDGVLGTVREPEAFLHVCLLGWGLLTWPAMLFQSAAVRQILFPRLIYQDGDYSPGQ